MRKEELAIFGGPKSINRPHPHWQWPPKSQARIDAAVQYLEDPRDNEKGYPLVVEEFEKAFAAYHGLEFALATNSGTSSLHAAFFAVGLGPGDEIIAPTMTFIATATPIAQLGAMPVFCDCEPDTGNIDPADIRRKITDKTKAIVVTHLCGHPCEMNEIVSIAQEHNLYLIEDCSHAHGATYDNKLVGTFGDAACFSLGRKILTSGEGGVMLTNDRLLFERGLMLSDFGPRLHFDLTLPETRKYVDTGLGIKARMHPLSAAILNVELAVLDEYVVMREEKLNYFSNGLEDVAGLTPPVTREGTTRGGYFGYRPFLHSDQLNGLDIQAFLKIMHAEGMEVRQSNNPPLHRLNLFAEMSAERSGISTWPANDGIVDLPNSDVFFNSTLSLPTFTKEPLNVIDDYISAFNKVCTYFSNNDAVKADDLPENPSA